MLMLPALSRQMQLYSHKVIGEIIIAVSPNIAKKRGDENSSPRFLLIQPLYLQMLYLVCLVVVADEYRDHEHFASRVQCA